MNTMLDKSAREAMIARVTKMTPDSKRQWGKMRPDQAMHHINKAISNSLGDFDIPYNGNFMLTLLKPLILRMPMPKGKAETFALLKSEDTYDLQEEKRHFAELMQRYENKPNLPKQPKNALLGTMSANDWGLLDYTHTNHHLSQFGL